MGLGAKDHRPEKWKQKDFTPTGRETVPVSYPPGGNEVGAAPTKTGRPFDVEWTPERKKLWDTYWASVQSEYDAWNMHYKRAKWDLPKGRGNV